MNLVRSKMIETQQRVEGDLQYTWKTLDPAIQHQKLQQGFINMAQGEWNNIPDTGGIYSPAPLSHVLNIPVLSQLSIAKDLAPLAVSDPKYITKPEDFMADAITQIAAGKLTPAQAADQISTIYRGIIADNDTNRQYGRLGLPNLAEEMKFRTTVNIGSGYGTNQVIDMASRPAVEAAITRMIIFRQIGGAAGGMLKGGIGP